MFQKSRLTTTRLNIPIVFCLYKILSIIQDGIWISLHLFSKRLNFVILYSSKLNTRTILFNFNWMNVIFLAVKNIVLICEKHTKPDCWPLNIRFGQNYTPRELHRHGGREYEERLFFYERFCRILYLKKAIFLDVVFSVLVWTKLSTLRCLNN